MVPFERALESFYRPSVVTFPLSLRVSEILPLLFSNMPLFPYPTASLPKISPCSLGLGGSPFGYKERRCWGRQTDRRHAIPRPRICTKVHCAVKMGIYIYFDQFVYIFILVFNCNLDPILHRFRDTAA